MASRFMLAALVASGLIASGGTAQEPAKLDIPMGDASLAAFLYRAPAATGTVLLLHGYPGWEMNHDVAAAIQRAGRNALVFNYRGTWESTGEFSFASALADAAALVQQLRAPGARERFGIAPGPVALVGHSFGSWIAFLMAAHDEQLHCAAGLALTDMGRLGQMAAQQPELADGMRRSALDPVARGFVRISAETDPVAMLRAAADSLELTTHLAALGERSLLVIQSSADLAGPPGQHVQPLLDALRARPGADLAYRLLATDHNFSTARDSLAAAVVSWLDEKCAVKRP